MENSRLLAVVVFQLNMKEPHITFARKFDLIVAHAQTLFSPVLLPENEEHGKKRDPGKEEVKYHKARKRKNKQRATRNGERGTGNGKRETGNGKRETGNGKRETGNGERGTGNGER